MDLDFTEEQEMLRAMVRELCEDIAPLAVVRALEDDPVGYPAELWKRMVDLDLVGLLLPAEHGGSAMSLVEGAVLYEELGRALAPSPHFVSAVVGGGVLARAATGGSADAWLGRVVRGEAVLTTAWLEPGNGFGPEGVQLPADGGSLTGVKWHVPFAAAADAFLVPARVGPAPADVEVFLVERSAPGVTLRQQRTIASDAQYEVRFDAAPAARVASWADWDRVLQDARVLLAASAIGGATRALELAVEYAKVRVQFDKPLGGFQAIAHDLADARTVVDGGRALVYEAAWAGAAGRPEARRLSAMAKLFAGQSFRDVTALAQQIFGGVGFTVDYDVQLYFRRAKQLQLSWGDNRFLEERVAAEVLGV